MNAYGQADLLAYNQIRSYEEESRMAAYAGYNDDYFNT